MTDGLSTHYQDLLGGSYDCVDRIVLNAYFRMGHDPGGFRLWWRALTGSDETLEQILHRIGHSRRYEAPPTGLRAITALVVLRNKAIKPLLAAAQPLRPTRGSLNPKPIDAHYHTLQAAMHGVFHELGLAA